MAAATLFTFLPGTPVASSGWFAWQPLAVSEDSSPLTSSTGLAGVADPLRVLEGAAARKTVQVIDAAGIHDLSDAGTDAEAGIAVTDIDVVTAPMLPVVRHLASLPLPQAGHLQDHGQFDGDGRAASPASGRPRSSGRNVAANPSLAPAVVAWSLAAKWALELVADGQLLPILRMADDPRHAVASWCAVVGGDERLDQLARSFPLEAFAMLRDDGTPWSARDLLITFCDAVADACARGGHQAAIDRRRRTTDGPLSERLTGALTGVDPIIELRNDRDRAALEQIDDWSSPVIGRVQASTAHLRLRLHPPSGIDEDSGGWRVVFSLGVRGDESASAATIDAAQIWASAGPVALGGQHIDDAQQLLVRWLALAARLYPPLARCLSSAEPAAMNVSSTEAAELLDAPAALRSAGVVIDVPPAMRDHGIERARLIARVGRTVEGDEPATMRDEAGLNLQDLTEMRFGIAVGDTVLDARESAALLSMGHGLVRWRGRWVRVESELFDQTELLGRDVSMSLTEALVAALSGRLHRAETGWIDTRAVGDVGEMVARLRAAGMPEEVSDEQLPAFRGALRPYQRRGVAWLLAMTRLGVGGVLADEMGLGKTVEAIGLLTAMPGDDDRPPQHSAEPERAVPGRPHLVVCPTSVVGNWQRELARFAPGFAVARHHGDERATRPEQLRNSAVVITTYALLRRDVALLGRIPWDVVIFDEAQQVKNARSQTARAAREMQASARFALTGTPLENRLADLWSIMDLTNPGLLGSRAAFEERFAVPIERWRDEDAADRLRRLVAPFVLRRRKADADVAVDLPPKHDVHVDCALTTEQAQLYRTVIDETMSGKLVGSTFERRGRILALLTALKQICDHPRLYLRDDGPIAGRSGKFDRAMSLMADVVDAGDQAIVFSQFRRMGDLVVEHVGTTLGIDVPFLHGGEPIGRRDAMVARFQRGEAPLLMVSLRAGGTGLNLTQANHVIHLDRWWNPAVEDQATDRAHRIGQRRAVTVHTMVTRGTLEERIGALLDRKRGLAEQVVGAGETWITELSDREIQELVELSANAMVADEYDDDSAEHASDELAAAHRLPHQAGARTSPSLVVLPGGRQ